MPWRGSSSVSISENFPSSYTPGQTCSIQISVSEVCQVHTVVSMFRSPKVRFQQAAILMSKSVVSLSHTRTKQIVHGVLIGLPYFRKWYGHGRNRWIDGEWRWNKRRCLDYNVREYNRDSCCFNNPPTASNVQISPSSPTSSDNILLTYTFSDQIVVIPNQGR